MNTWKLVKKLRETADELDEWKAPQRQDIHLRVISRTLDGAILSAHTVNIPVSPRQPIVKWEVIVPVQGTLVEMVCEAHAFESNRTE